MSATTPEDPRVTQAKIDQAVAEADKAKAEAAKAAVDAAKASREEAAATSTLGVQQREAETRKAIAEAKKADFDAQQSRVAALVPDLGKAQVPALAVSGDQALFGATVTQRALDTAAASLVEDVSAHLPAKGSGRVLLTSDPDLASPDASYVEVDAGLKMLAKAAAEALKPPSAGGIVAAAVAAVAAALPGLISFFAPSRSVSSHAVTLDDSSVVAAVAGRLATTHDVHLDDFRLVPQDGVVKRDKELMDHRDQLAALKNQGDVLKAELQRRGSAAQEKLDALLTAAKEAPDDPAAKQAVEDAAKERDDLTGQSTNLATETATVEDLVTAIDSFRTAIHTVPQGGTRSPLAVAALYEGLHATVSATDRYAAVLFVKSGGGSVEQLINDRKFMKDRFDVVGSVGVSYWLIDPTDSNVRAAGTATGRARMSGTIGSSEIKVSTF
jgi:hypothetical protein